MPELYIFEFLLGTQTWFAENLNYHTGFSRWYDNHTDNGDVYGRLYTWDAAMTAYPDGWHLPTDEEYKTFEINLGNTGNWWTGTEHLDSRA